MNLPPAKRRFPNFFYFLSFATVGLGFILPVLSAALVSLLMIFLLARISFGSDWTEFLFIQLNRKSLSWFFAAFIFALVAAGFVLQTANTQTINIQLWNNSSLVLLVTILLQSLSEEILFRVFLLRDFLSKLIHSRFVLILSSAALFSVAHLVNYVLRDGVYLSGWSLMSLFLMGCAASILFFRNKHLWGVWGFHTGWNFVRFSSDFNVNNEAARESQRFEILEGSWVCVMLALFLCVASRYPPEAAKASR